MVSALGLTYPQFTADHALLEPLFGESGSLPVPATLILDPSGALRRVYVRVLEEGELREILASLLSKGVSWTDLRELGRRELLHLRYDPALVAFRAALKERPEDAETLNLMGMALVGLGKVDEGAWAFERATERDSSLGSAWVNLGAARAQQRRYPEALEAYQKAVLLEGERPSTLCSLGGAAATSGKLAVALDAFERAIRASDNSAEAHAGRGKVLILMKRSEDARASLRRAIELSPDNAEYRDLLGKLGG
jgi:tetratricopeptide (TPR) repeat protein